MPYKNLADKKANAQKYYLANKELYKSRAATNHRNDPWKNASRCARNAAKKEGRLPLWLTKDHFKEMDSFYEWAAYLNGEWDVDHIEPRNGAHVSGLHVPWNLQVITRADNIAKGTR